MSQIFAQPSQPRHYSMIHELPRKSSRKTLETFLTIHQVFVVSIVKITFKNHQGTILLHSFYLNDFVVAFLCITDLWVVFTMKNVLVTHPLEDRFSKKNWIIQDFSKMAQERICGWLEIEDCAGNYLRDFHDFDCSPSLSHSPFLLPCGSWHALPSGLIAWIFCYK